MKPRRATRRRAAGISLPTVVVVPPWNFVAIDDTKTNTHGAHHHDTLYSNPSNSTHGYEEHHIAELRGALPQTDDAEDWVAQLYEEIPNPAVPLTSTLRGYSDRLSWFIVSRGVYIGEAVTHRFMDARGRRVRRFSPK